MPTWEEVFNKRCICIPCKNLKMNTSDGRVVCIPDQEVRIETSLPDVEYVLIIKKSIEITK